MPRATAKIGDTIIAEADSWETVEGNVYVRIRFLKNSFMSLPTLFFPSSLRYPSPIIYSLAFSWG